MKGMIHMEIIRKNELQEILELVEMKPYGKFLITGVAGSGKTALLNIAGKTLEERGKRIRYGGLSVKMCIRDRLWSLACSLSQISTKRPSATW